MSEAGDWIVLGRFGRVHGIKGFITIHSYTEPRENILNYSQLYARINSQWQPLEVTRIESTSKSILALIAGYTEREQAAHLTNIELGVPKDQLPRLADGEYYWHQLIGLTVVNQQGEKLGNVADLLATGSNDVLVVQGEKQVLIPFLPGRYVSSVDIDAGMIFVDWDADF